MACKIEVHEDWDSIVNEETEGTFKIITIHDNQGNFTGEFLKQDSQNPVEIKGRCKGNTIWFFRQPDTGESTEFFYSGAFTGSKKAEGTHLRVGSQVFDAAGKLQGGPDDWVSEPTVTLLKKGTDYSRS